jgi:hypothetical protein
MRDFTDYSVMGDMMEYCSVAFITHKQIGTCPVLGITVRPVPP